MTKLDLVLARIRQLPAEEQEQIAEEIEFILDQDRADYRLTPDQEAELARRLADPNRQYVSHEDVSKYLEKKYGR